MAWTKVGERLFKALFGGGDVLAKEKIIINKLKTCQDKREVVMICSGLGLIGSIYSFPTLMALLKDDLPREVSRALQNAFDDIAYKYLGDNSLPRYYFSEDFWEPTWTGGHSEFLSMITALGNINPGMKEDDVEELAITLTKELKIDISPYQTFRELMLCTNGWDPGKDLEGLLEGAQTDLLMSSVLEGSQIETESDMEDFIADQKNDYLLTRVKFFENFEANHYLLGKIACLNRSETII